MSEKTVTFILELIRAVFDAQNGADDPYTLYIPTQQNIEQTEARLARLSALSGIDLALLRSRIRMERAE